MDPSRDSAGQSGHDADESAAQPSVERPERPRRGGRRSSGRTGPDAALSRELADFLVEFSIVLHKRAMYPAGHPQLEASADRFVRRLDTLLARRESVTLGVARHQLVIEKVTTDPNNALLRDLARRLHRHRIASVRFMAGTSLEEIDSLLGALSADPARGAGPLGPRLPELEPWAHIELHAAAYDRLALEVERADTGDDATPQRDRWIELAQAAVATDPPPPEDEESLIVTDRSVTESELTYDRVVTSYLSQLAEERSGRVGAGESRLRQRVERLVRSLDPETLRRLLEAGADQAARRRAALDSSQILAVDAVVEVLEAAAETPEHTISHNLLRLLHKLAHNAPRSDRGEANRTGDAGLRKNIAQLLGNWGLEDPNPGSYNAILEGMVRQAPADRLMDTPVPLEPATVIRMALELDCIGPSVLKAVDHLIELGELQAVAGLLMKAPPCASVETLWNRVATPERLRAEFAGDQPDFAIVSLLVARLGDAAAEPLIDALERATGRTTRAAVLRFLREGGPGMRQAAADRLPDAPWFLQRNLLQLFLDPATWPGGFSPAPYAKSPDARVRREAIKVMLHSRPHRNEGLELGLRDSDARVLGMTLGSAREECPPLLIPLLDALARNEKVDMDLRVLAIRSLVATGASDAVSRLIMIAFPARRWLPNRLAPKSPAMLAALAGVCALGSTDPRVKWLIARARRDRDPEIRAAAGDAA
ncbi:MAG: hypothetical protein ACM357_08860 [Gemmatimonadota bacterium]